LARPLTAESQRQIVEPGAGEVARRHLVRAERGAALVVVAGDDETIRGE
jgi:hypothetical protein